MANKGQITKRLVQSKAGKKGIQEGVGLYKENIHLARRRTRENKS